MAESEKTTSGPSSKLSRQLDHEETVANVRAITGIPAERGLDAEHIVAGVIGFLDQFEFWYVRVLQNAVLEYRDLIVARINPFVRRVEFHSWEAQQVASRLVDDYDSRNFVTAGGWAIEWLATEGSPTGHKSTATGIDLERHDPATKTVHLYVIKSGTVTRNSDILAALKRNARQAETRLRQGRAAVEVRANYAVAVGKTTTTFADGIWRPSSAQFWSEMYGLPEEDAIETALAMATEAGRHIQREASVHVHAMKRLVEVYIARPGVLAEVDWEFIARRTMRAKPVWQSEDAERHIRALQALTAMGYELPTRVRGKRSST